MFVGRQHYFPWLGSARVPYPVTEAYEEAAGIVPIDTTLEEGQRACRVNSLEAVML